MSFTHVVHEAVLEEHPSCYGVDRFAVHFFDVFYVAADWDLICWFENANPREETEMPHFFHSVGDMAMDCGRKT